MNSNCPIQTVFNMLLKAPDTIDTLDTISFYKIIKFKLRNNTHFAVKGKLNMKKFCHKYLQNMGQVNTLHIQNKIQMGCCLILQLFYTKIRYVLTHRPCNIVQLKKLLTQFKLLAKNNI
ncbi:hypothetical protein DOS84_10600 [Flavobacterium aquariorum]|uniref:Uncharacterized protein n=1 Tax=Flavobacterium aquariorum TaxID=2217670 RepID=A0A2W7TTE3_9FLAO|nr:hypothetical protein DOS84_10600 [Flavobacterium aquariorum]